MKRLFSALLGLTLLSALLPGCAARPQRVGPGSRGLFHRGHQLSRL